MGDPKLEPNFFREFKRISELIVSIEDTSLLILKRCSQEDRFLTSLLAQICREVGYKDSPPLCGALSFQYFQALMETDIIMTPQGQASELLALPDLYHELAHFVVYRERPVLEVPVLAIIHKYFADAVRKGPPAGIAAGHVGCYREELNAVDVALARGICLRHGSDLLVWSGLRPGQFAAQRDAW